MSHYVLDARTATPHFPGIGSYCASIAQALIPLLEEDERLSILVDGAHPLDLPPHARAASIPLDISPFSLRQQWAIPRMLRQLDADVYHSAYYLMPYRPGVPTLVTFYDLIPIRFPQYSTFRARALFRLSSRLALKAAHQGIVISSATQQDMVRYLHADPARLTLTPLSAAPQFTPQPAAAVEKIRACYSLPPRFILYLGSNKPHKNLSRLVEAYAPLRDSQITLVVAGTWLAQYPEPRRLADTLGLDQSHIRWLGAIPGHDLPALYTAALVFVFPSLMEGFGLPVVEAMACGTPVACSRIPSLEEVAGDAAEFFDPANTASITGALRHVIQDTARRTTLRQRALTQAVQFSWQQTARVTLNLYRRCLDISF
jgi:glycosyltransferase involved in cell wall biosynthesis